MKKSTLSITAFVLSLFPFITLLSSILNIKIEGNLQTGFVVFNIISILSAIILSIIQVKDKRKRDVFSILALCISSVLGVLMIGISIFGILATFG
ncbi:hypothetical protein HGO97_004070 [Faecalicatena sp. AGMB00832]|uniref:Uncharacterized protein n=1 Tax=Faecalicatena faecalis TaxID=2726362 RepID=A0ABS6D0W6_9FIRM|nr:hypothetical protein [Faecalicatena faecalis]MBU3874990.1 hypothetical protein [Faecalicatena faecalis]